MLLAKKVYVNIDKVAYKSLRVNIDLFINNDANNFFNKIKKIKINKKFMTGLNIAIKLKIDTRLKMKKNLKKKAQYTISGCRYII